MAHFGKNERWRWQRESKWNLIHKGNILRTWRWGGYTNTYTYVSTINIIHLPVIPLAVFTIYKIHNINRNKIRLISRLHYVDGNFGNLNLPTYVIIYFFLHSHSFIFLFQDEEYFHAYDVWRTNAISFR